MKNVAKWLFVFFALGTVTYGYFQPYSGETKVALAKMKEDGKHAIEVRTDVDKKLRDKLVDALYGRKTICEIDNEDFAVLEDKYGAELTTVYLRWIGDLPLVRVGTEEQTLGQLKRTLKKLDVKKCVVVNTRGWFYLLFTGDVS